MSLKTQTKISHRNRPIILASSSPRRKKILTEMGYQFSVISPDVDEKIYESAQKTVSENSKLKAEAVLKTKPDALIIAADTVVALDDKILCKPADMQEAEKMLLLLSGKKHQVMTGVTILSAENEHSYCEISEVEFKTLSMSQIKKYFSLCNPLDKAGGYNIDEYGNLIIEKIYGSYSNIMGLPKESLGTILKKLIFF